MIIYDINQFVSHYFSECPTTSKTKEKRLANQFRMPQFISRYGSFRTLTVIYRLVPDEVIKLIKRQVTDVKSAVIILQVAVTLLSYVLYLRRM